MLRRCKSTRANAASGSVGVAQQHRRVQNCGMLTRSGNTCYVNSVLQSFSHSPEFAALLRAEGGLHGYDCLLLECDACIVQPVQPVLREQLAGARNTVVVPKDIRRHLLKFVPQFVPGCKKTGTHPSPPYPMHGYRHAWHAYVCCMVGVLAGMPCKVCRGSGYYILLLAFGVGLPCVGVMFCP